MSLGRTAAPRCQVPSCKRDATAGEDWLEPPLDAVSAFRLGVELRLTVRDLAVVLALCEEHGTELATAAWAPAEELLSRWRWQPLPGSGSDGISAVMLIRFAPPDFRRPPGRQDGIRRTQPSGRHHPVRRTTEALAAFCGRRMDHPGHASAPRTIWARGAVPCDSVDWPECLVHRAQRREPDKHECR